MSDAATDLGIQCPACGCRHCPEQSFTVLRTIALAPNRSIRRQRACRYCGRRFVTIETVLPVADVENNSEIS